MFILNKSSLVGDIFNSSWYKLAKLDFEFRQRLIQNKFYVVVKLYLQRVLAY